MFLILIWKKNKMCGICGFISRQTVSLKNLQVMNDTMYHRGPDDSGYEIIERYGLNYGIAQRRLSIMDLSSAGHQPMHSVDNDIVLAFNGEIYNFKKLKEELKEYPFKSECDTEVIIAAYKKWGIDCVSHFNGMFAIALLDLKQNTLFLVRDRFGKKPLYYYIDNEEVSFASELKPIIKYENFKKELNTDVLGEFLTKQYITAPRTIFKNVYKVRPGEIISISDYNLKKSFFWDYNEIYNKRKNTYKKSYKNAITEMKSLLEQAVEYRMIADVPVGVLLSGGFDSSVITALAQRKSSKKIKTYTIGFNDKSLNEAEYAKEIASYLGTEHTEYYISEVDMLRLVKDLPKFYDEPFADSSQIATMLVSQMAKKDVTVVLGGDGADELFGGYRTHKLLPFAQCLDGIGALINFLYSNFSFVNKIYERLPFAAKMIISNRDRRYKTQFEKYMNLNLTRKILKNSNNELFDESYIHEKKWQIRRMILDTQTYLPDDIMCKVDRASMSCSLESRAPFLDYNFAEFALSLPQKFKFHKSNGKRILKDLAYSMIPKYLLDRPKAGFSVPVAEWLQNELKEDLLSFCDTEFLERQNIFNVDETQELIHSFLNTAVEKKRGKKIDSFIWGYFVFQQWYKEYMC